MTLDAKQTCQIVCVLKNRDTFWCCIGLLSNQKANKVAADIAIQLRFLLNSALMNAVQIKQSCMGLFTFLICRCFKNIEIRIGKSRFTKKVPAK